MTSLGNTRVQQSAANMCHWYCYLCTGMTGLHVRSRSVDKPDSYVCFIICIGSELI